MYVLYKNVALIFAGGVGQRMHNGALPKQFLELHGKPIIIYTLEKFEQNTNVDAIVVVCVKGWEKYLQEKINIFGLKKVVKVITGGESAMHSQFLGLKYVKDNLHVDDETLILFHDGVRPLVDEKTINKNIECAKLHGSAITVVPAIETVGLMNSSGELNEFIDRSKSVLARAPQTYKLQNIFNAHMKAAEDGNRKFIDSATMMQFYNYKIYTVEGSPSNIKVTTPTDFYIFRAILDAEENQQIFGGN